MKFSTGIILQVWYAQKLIIQYTWEAGSVLYLSISGSSSSSAEAVATILSSDINLVPRNG